MSVFCSPSCPDLTVMWGGLLWSTAILWTASVLENYDNNPGANNLFLKVMCIVATVLSGFVGIVGLVLAHVGTETDANRKERLRWGYGAYGAIACLLSTFVTLDVFVPDFDQNTFVGLILGTLVVGTVVLFVYEIRTFGSGGHKKMWIGMFATFVCLAGLVACIYLLTEQPVPNKTFVFFVTVISICIFFMQELLYRKTDREMFMMLLPVVILVVSGAVFVFMETYVRGVIIAFLLTEVALFLLWAGLQIFRQ